MKLGIRYRLFFSLLAATGIVAIGMFLIMQWSVSRGFLQYVNTLDQDRLERVAVEFETAFDRTGSWDFLREDSDALFRLLERAFPEKRGMIRRLEKHIHPPDREETFDSHRPVRPLPEHLPPRMANLFVMRLLLLDADRRPVFGPHEKAGEVDLMPLTHNGDVVGYLGLVPKKRFSDVRQLRFIREQKLAFGLVAALMLVVSALLALPLANRLVRPIRALAAGTRRLGAGEYDFRVPVDSDDELGQLARDFNALALALGQNEKDRRQWVADISHELRTPLAVLRGEIEALQDGVRPQSPQALASLHGEVLQLARLVDDLYQLSLSDLGALNYRKEPLDLVEVADQVVEALRPRFDQKEIALELELPPTGKALFHGDRARLNQLLTNLLENSLKYTDPGGRLAFHLGCSSGRIVIDLEDSAPGVSTTDLERLFERLYRVEGSRSRATGGAGLGLSICRNIVEAHGGTITADHSSLGGLWIKIELPGKEGKA